MHITPTASAAPLGPRTAPQPTLPSALMRPLLSAALHLVAARRPAVRARAAVCMEMAADERLQVRGEAARAGRPVS